VAAAHANDRDLLKFARGDTEHGSYGIVRGAILYARAGFPEDAIDVLLEVGPKILALTANEASPEWALGWLGDIRGGLQLVPRSRVGQG
jgi:hypothetical protein